MPVLPDVHSHRRSKCSIVNLVFGVHACGVMHAYVLHIHITPVWALQLQLVGARQSWLPVHSRSAGLYVPACLTYY